MSGRSFAAAPMYRGAICLGLIQAVLLLVLSAAGSAAEPASTRESIAWNQDVRTAWQTSIELHRPLLVFITMDDCMYCQKMKKTTLLDRQVVSALRTEFVPVAVNVKDQPELVKRLLVKSYPTTVIILNNGDVIDFIAGYQSAKQLHERLVSTLRQAAREQHATTVVR